MFLVIFAPLKKMVVVAQLVRASDCDSEGRGFEPPRLPIKKDNALLNCIVLFYYTALKKLIKNLPSTPLLNQ